MSLDLFTPADTAVLLIDHQEGTTSWVHSMNRGELKANAFALAKAATALEMPLVLTSSMEEDAQGALAAEFATIAPTAYADRVRRTGVVNAMDDPNFARAVRDTGRTNLIVAGVTNDVCTVYPTLSALELGYRVQVVADAGGSMSKAADDIALRRMEQEGAELVSTNMALTGLIREWTSPTGQALIPIVGELIPA